MGPSEGGYFVSFSARLCSLVSLLHHTFLWQNSADWQGMNDARCFGTDPSLPPFFFPGGGAAISMMRRHKMGTASAARAQHKQRRGIDGLETKKQARKGTCFKGRVSASVIPLSEGRRGATGVMPAKPRKEKESAPQPSYSTARWEGSSLSYIFVVLSAIPDRQGAQKGAGLS